MEAQGEIRGSVSKRLGKQSSGESDRKRGLPRGKGNSTKALPGESCKRGQCGMLALTGQNGSVTKGRETPVKDGDCLDNGTPHGGQKQHDYGQQEKWITRKW